VDPDKPAFQLQRTMTLKTAVETLQAFSAFPVFTAITEKEIPYSSQNTKIRILAEFSLNRIVMRFRINNYWAFFLPEYEFLRSRKMKVSLRELVPKILGDQHQRVLFVDEPTGKITRIFTAREVLDLLTRSEEVT